MSELDIIHVDMDAFFAAVEQLDNPELRGKPVIIGGTSRRGVVSTASYEARKYGVHSAMPAARARKLCPEGIFLPGRRERYVEMSQEIFALLRQFTPRLEKISIDEAFLDITGCHDLFGTSREIGRKIKDNIRDKTGLIASVGISYNKFLAKLASDMDKPDGLVIISREKAERILSTLPVGKLWGVGEKTEKTLLNMGIKTVGKLKTVPLSVLEDGFGKLGIRLHKLAHGIDTRKVVTDSEIKSISHEKTFSISLQDREQLLAELMQLTEKVNRRLRKNKVKGSTIIIKIRYDDFQTLTRRKTLAYPIDDVEIIYNTGRDLLLENDLLQRPVRLLGIGVGSLKVSRQKQLSLFDDRLKKEKLNTALDRIKNKFGDDSIKRARNLFGKNKER